MKWMIVSSDYTYLCENATNIARLIYQCNIGWRFDAMIRGGRGRTIKLYAYTILDGIETM